jgi:nucleotide-binding universal stress UspA family protein
MARSGGGIAMAAFPANVAEIDEVSEQAARERADEGVELARGAGLDPQPRIRQHTMTIADTILSEADDVGADLIVLGSRGLTGLKSLLLGSVSHALLQHTDRAVLVVPSAKVATERSEHRRKADSGLRRPQG